MRGAEGCASVQTDEDTRALFVMSALPECEGISPPMYNVQRC